MMAKAGKAAKSKPQKTVEHSNTIVVDFSKTNAHDHALASNKVLGDVSHCVALILAYSLRTTPLTVEFEDPDQEKVTLESDQPQVRALQCFEGETLIERAIKTAQLAGAARVCVVAPSETHAREAHAVRDAALAAGAHDVVFYDRNAAEEARKASGNFELCEVSAYLLQLGLEKLEVCSPATSLLIMGCEQPRLTSEHVRMLAGRAQEKPEADVIASWIVWLRRLPVLITEKLIAKLPALMQQRCAASCSPQAFAPLPQFCIEDVVFGEEKLAPNTSTPDSVQTFFDGLTLDALGAVRLAHKLEEGAEEAEDLTANLSEADKLLLACAQETLAATALVPTAPADTDVAQATYAPEACTPENLQNVSTWAVRNKLDFPLFSDRKQRDHLVFLDSAATAQRCQQSLQAQYDFDVHENANVYRGSYELSMQATATLNDARAVLESFIGANRRETIFTSNTSAGANLIAQAWGDANISAGDIIVTSQCDHHSNMLPWMLLAQRKGAKVVYLPCLSDGRIDQQVYRHVLQQKPKLVCLTHISNVLGMVNPIQEMAALAKRTGARVFVDGAQAAPHVRVNVQELGVDFYAISAHKMYGPMGLGAVWVNPDCYSEMTPASGGGGVISHEAFDSYYLRTGAIGYEVGTPAVSQAVGFAAALKYLGALDMSAVQCHSSVLTQYLVRGLHAIDSVSIWGNHNIPEGETGLVSMTLHGVSSSEAGAFLGKLGVAVRSGGHCAIPLSGLLGVAGTVRASIGVYNTAEDIEAFLCALRACKRSYDAEFDAANDKAEVEADRVEAEQTERKKTQAVKSKTNKTETDTVEAHYARVALDVLATLEDDTVCGCASCEDAPLKASEAVALYSEQIRNSLPSGALQASRGCGDPVAKAQLQAGERVLDLGCGGGIDALIAARLVGKQGSVYGVDMTPEMVQLATKNASDAQAGNVTFLQGNIEKLPLQSESVDVVLSNCVINFSNDKPQVMREAYRVLAPGGRFVVSDIVSYAPIRKESYEPLCRIVGCTNGMSSAQSYVRSLEEAGFVDVRLERKTNYTFDVLKQRAQQKGRMEFFQRIENDAAMSGACGSVIVYAYKR